MPSSSYLPHWRRSILSATDSWNRSILGVFWEENMPKQVTQLWSSLLYRWKGAYLPKLGTSWVLSYSEDTTATMAVSKATIREDRHFSPSHLSKNAYHFYLDKEFQEKSELEMMTKQTVQDKKDQHHIHSKYSYNKIWLEDAHLKCTVFQAQSARKW